jgi:hypothetical protein
VPDERDEAARRAQQPFLDEVNNAQCCGESAGCRRTVRFVVVCLRDAGQGYHVLPPLDLYTSCRRHRSKVLEIALADAAPGEAPSVHGIAEVDAIVTSFNEGAWHGRSGAISVATPRHATPRHASRAEA